MLVQDLGKFQTHRWLHAFRMHYSVCFLVKRSLESLIFAYEHYYYKYINLLGCHRPKLDNVESYILTGNRQLSVQYY